ncbi:MAG: hypothetical protein LBT47_05650 [Deltaproteobacteria bacterium]|jgi:hypothetical protein|nr:hypothetical protein [Deltaproteobacteria bacterium]
MKKRHGHYCCVCDQFKANEKFSGRGHSTHICKVCAKLQVNERETQQLQNKITFFYQKHRLSQKDREYLTKISKDAGHPKAAEDAKSFLADYDRERALWRELSKDECVITENPEPDTP